jgi:hypothetical protein
MGELTTNEWFYKPAYRESGASNYNSFCAALDASDLKLEGIEGDVATLGTSVTALGSLVNNWAIEDNILTMVTATPTYVDNNTFTVPGDYTSRFSAGAVVHVLVAAGMVYSTVDSSSYGAGVTTVNLDDTVLTDPITRVYVVATRDGLWPNGPGYVVASDYGSDLAALTAADAVATAAKKKLLIGQDTWTIDDNLTLSAPEISISAGAVLDFADTKTMTINGSLDAGPYQVFSWTGTGKVKFSATSPQMNLYPEWWGAVGDVVLSGIGPVTITGTPTDDYVAFDAAVECAWNSGRGNIILSRIYKLSKTLSIYNFHNANQKNITVVGVGSQRSGIYSTAYGYPAVEVLGCWQGVFSDFGIFGSATNGETPSVALMTSRTTQAVYSGLRSNGQSCNSDNVFERLWIGGTFQWGIIYDMNGSNNRYANITSYGGPLALAHADNHWRFGIGITGGTLLTGNPFSLPSRYVDAGGNSTANTASDNVTVVDVGIMTNGKSADIPADAGAAYIYGATWVNIRNVYFGSISNSNTDLYQLVNGATGQFIGVPTESACRNVVSITSDSALTYSRIRMEGFHGTGANTYGLITDTNSALKNCYFDLTGITPTGGTKVSLGKSAQYCDFYLPQTATSFTNATTGTNGLIGCYINTGSMLTELILGAVGYSKNNIINDQRNIHGGVSGTQVVIDGDVRIGQPSSATPNILTVNNYKMTWGTAAPSTGSWAQGSVVWKSDVAAGGSPGWVNTADGTFTAISTTGSIDNLSTYLTVDSTSGMVIGSYITIAGVTGVKRIVNINTTTKVVTIHAASDATVAGAAVANSNTAVFKAMPNVAA